MHLELFSIKDIHFFYSPRPTRVIRCFTLLLFLETSMDDDFLNDHDFFEKVNIADTPWLGDNLLFGEFLNDSNEDVADLFNGREKDDEGFDEETISNPGTPLCVEEIRDEEIKNLRLQELNKILRCMSQDEAAKIRRRRRNLKNRGYALTCRKRRMQLQEDLINETNILRRQLDENRQKLEIVTKERDTYKRKYLQLRSECKRA